VFGFGDLSLRALECMTILNPYITLLVECVQTLWRTIIDYFLLAAKGAVSGVFAYYPHTTGHGLAEP